MNRVFDWLFVATLAGIGTAGAIGLGVWWPVALRCSAFIALGYFAALPQFEIQRIGEVVDI